MSGEKIRPLSEALRIAALAGALVAPASAEAPYAQHDLTYEQASQRMPLRERLRRMKSAAPMLKAESPLRKSESHDLDHSWNRILEAFLGGLDRRVEMGGIHAGSEDARRAIGRLGNGGRSDAFVVDEKLLQPVIAYLQALHASRPPQEAFDLCVVHTHPRHIAGIPVQRIASLPPSAADLKEILDPGLVQELREYVGRDVRYREAVVDVKGMWIFERSGAEGGIELSLETARRIHDAQLTWARYVAARPERSVAELVATSGYRELLDAYRTFGVSLSYVSHADARRMPLCRAPGA